MLHRIRRKLNQGKTRVGYLAVLAVVFAGLYVLRPSFGQLPSVSNQPSALANPPAVPESMGFHYFAPLSADSNFSGGERAALWGSLIVALLALAYAGMLVGQVVGADKGTAKMQQIAAAVREGANAYLARQLKVVCIMIVILVAVLYCTRAFRPDELAHTYALGRAGAFLMGALFSGLVGFVGMRMATVGNLRVAAAAPHGFGKALMYGYRSGTITGMMTDGLGLLGGTIIFMMYGEHAYEALLGFGFGGTLLALFMRVGGGIYTKAADVGADLVGKVEKDIP
jgi:K(+)-stimulated pyrophosphate-energized sodium pump